MEVRAQFSKPSLQSLKHHAFGHGLPQIDGFGRQASDRDQRTAGARTTRDHPQQLKTQIGRNRGTGCGRTMPQRPGNIGR